MFVGTKQSFKLVVPANQVRFTLLTKYITSGLDDAVMVTIMGFVKGNGVGSYSRVGMVYVTGAGIISVVEIGISFGGNYSVSFGIKVGAGINLRDAEICLNALPAKVGGPVSSQFNIVATISTINYGHLTPISSIVYMNQAIKPLVLFFWALFIPQTIVISVVIRPFENT